MTFKAMGSTPDRGARLILYDGHAPIGRGVQCSRRCYKLSGVIKVDESALFALIMNDNLRIVSSGAGHIAPLQAIHLYGSEWGMHDGS